MPILPVNNPWKLRMHTTSFWFPPIMPNIKLLISVVMSCPLVDSRNCIQHKACKIFSSMSKKYLVTGAAGFIASQVSKQLLDQGDHVVGVDNLNDYYDVRLKNWRLEQLKAHPNAENFSFACLDIEDQANLAIFFRQRVHLMPCLTWLPVLGFVTAWKTLMYTFPPMPKVPSTYSSACGRKDAKKLSLHRPPPSMQGKRCRSLKTLR